MYHLQYR